MESRGDIDDVISMTCGHGDCECGERVVHCTQVFQSLLKSYIVLALVLHSSVYTRACDVEQIDKSYHHNIRYAEALDSL